MLIIMFNVNNVKCAADTCYLIFNDLINGVICCLLSVIVLHYTVFHFSYIYSLKY